MPLNVFLDLDQTLFDHMSFADWLDAYLVKKGLLPGGGGSFRGSIDNFHQIVSGVPLLRLYDHERHLQSVSTTTWKELKPSLLQQARSDNKDFCYPDVHHFLHWLEKQPYNVRILSFGREELQIYKTYFCSYLRDHPLPIQIVDWHKADYIAKHFPSNPGVLIDDKYPLNLPPDWTHLWIDRSSSFPESQTVALGVIKISSLALVPVVLKTLVSSK